MKKIKISQIQFEAKSTPIQNAKILNDYFDQAIKFKPNLICTPECSNIITGDKSYLLKNTNFESDCPVLDMAKIFAKNKYDVHLVSRNIEQLNINKKEIVNLYNVKCKITCMDLLEQGQKNLLSYILSIHLVAHQVETKGVYFLLINLSYLVVGIKITSLKILD